MQKARRHFIAKLRPLVGAGFQGLFHPLIQGTFHLSLTVLVHFRSLNVFSLAGWYRRIQTGFRWSRPTQDPTKAEKLTRTGLSPSLAYLSR